MQICFFGDSVCVGQRISPHHSWVNRISSQLASQFNENPPLVMNASVNGNTTRMALERMPFDVQAYSPEIVYVQFGLNDCNHWVSDKGVPRVSLEAFGANILEIVTRLLRFDTQKILLATNHITDIQIHPSLNVQSYDYFRRMYNQEIRSRAQQLPVTLIDHEHHWEALLQGDAELSQLLLPDGIHLSAIGHQHYLDVVWPILLTSMEDLVCQS